jgi:hypothetical protein
VTTFADERIRPFRIDIHQDELNGLRERLDRTRWPDERTNNIVQWTQNERGGHFAAMEQPELMVVT